MARRHLVWLAVAAALAATALAVSAVVGAALDDVPGSLARRLPLWLILTGMASLAMMVVAAWLLATSRPIASIGLAVAVAGIAIPIEAARSGVLPSIRATFVGFAPLLVAGVAIVGFGWLAQGRDRRRAVLPLGLVAASVVVQLLAYDPFTEPGCVLTCEFTSTLADGVVSTRAAVTISGVLVVLAAVVAGVALLRERRGRGLVMAGVLVALATLAAGWVVRMIRWDELPSPALAALPVVAATVAIGVTTFVAAVHERHMRNEVRRVVDGLARTGSIAGPGMIRELHFAIPDDGGWVDEFGHDAPEVLDGRAIVIAEGEVPSVRIIVGSGVDDESVLLALTPAARLALRNAQLAALSRARLAQVQASRRQIVAVSDTERARIERDLHDGAQQRLVAATFHLNLALNRGVGTDGAAARADELVRVALSNLRHLAHGIFPASLSTNGLRAALEELVGTSDTRVRLELDDLRLPPDAAFAVYAVVAAGLDVAAQCRADQVVVRVVEGDGEVAVDVDLPSASFPEDAFIDVGDRVAALGGSVTTARDDSVTKVTARLPCGS